MPQFEFREVKPRKLYFFIKYPDGTYHSRVFPNTVEGEENAESWEGTMEGIGCFHSQTDKKTYEKHKDALGGKCELCREGEGNYSAGCTKMCQACAQKLSDETKWLRDRIAAEKAKRQASR